MLGGGIDMTWRMRQQTVSVFQSHLFNHQLFYLGSHSLSIASIAEMNMFDSPLLVLKVAHFTGALFRDLDNWNPTTKPTTGI